MLDKRKMYRLKRDLKAIGQAFIRLNVISQKIAETQTGVYAEERPKEPVIAVATTIYEEWLIWTYGATDMSYLLYTDVRPLPIAGTAEFEDLSEEQKAPFILAAKRIVEAIGRTK